MRFAVETWAPEYGVGADEEALEDGGEAVDVDVEVPAAAWAPVRPADRPATRVTFVDGVRRIDARVWITDDAGVHAGVCASVAAGAVVADGAGARVVEHRVERAVVATGATAGEAIDTVHGPYGFVSVHGDEPEAVYLAIHELMTALEAGVATTPDGGVVVYDGPLRGRHAEQAVGYVKTQRVRYLPDALMPVLTSLDDGERTPLFLIGGRGFRRWSCYVRLPGPRSHPLAGIVRLELPGAAVDAAGRAGMLAATLPRFASEPHKEPRAPQNLYPIAGLEQRLRHLLGDPFVMERALRRAAGDQRKSPTSSSTSATAGWPAASAASSAATAR